MGLQFDVGNLNLFESSFPKVKPKPMMGIKSVCWWSVYSFWEIYLKDSFCYKKISILSFYLFIVNVSYHFVKFNVHNLYLTLIAVQYSDFVTILHDIIIMGFIYSIYSKSEHL